MRVTIVRKSSSIVAFLAIELMCQSLLTGETAQPANLDMSI